MSYTTSLFNDAPVGMAMRFLVDITTAPYNLGAWSKCEGLAVKFDTDTYEELGQNTFIHHLPKRTTYTNVKLTRAMTTADSSNVLKWLNEMNSEPKPTSMTIHLQDAFLNEIASWTLRNVYPFQWTGPSLDATSKNMAVEVLELRHEGFLEA